MNNFHFRGKEKLYLVRLQNPWGTKEWTGPFSDTCVLVTVAFACKSHPIHHSYLFSSDFATHFPFFSHSHAFSLFFQWRAFNGSGAFWARFLVHLSLPDETPFQIPRMGQHLREPEGKARAHLQRRRGILVQFFTNEVPLFQFQIVIALIAGCRLTTSCTSSPSWPFAE